MTIKQLAQLFLLLIWSLTGVNAQLINNQYGEAFTDQPFFNTEEIKQKKIKSIHGHFTHYKLGDGLKKTKLYRAYQFNEKGQLVKQLETFDSEDEMDTLTTHYKYDSKQNLTSVLTRGKQEITKILYSYDNQNRVIVEEKRTLSLLTSEYSKSTHTVAYSHERGYLRKTIYNSEGEPYKFEDVRYNERGKVTEMIERLKSTGEETRTTYFYNDEALLDSLVRSSDLGKQLHESYSYSYDEDKNLIDKKYYKNGEEVQLQKMIYHLEKRTLENIVIHEFSTNFTRILKLEDYIYFDG